MLYVIEAGMYPEEAVGWLEGPEGADLAVLEREFQEALGVPAPPREAREWPGCWQGSEAWFEQAATGLVMTTRSASWPGWYGSAGSPSGRLCLTYSLSVAVPTTQ